jgi:hypothetical protein
MFSPIVEPCLADCLLVGIVLVFEVFCKITNHASKFVSHVTNRVTNFVS